MALRSEDKAYLIQRGYTHEMLSEEAPFSLPPGPGVYDGLAVTAPDDAIGFWLRSMPGTRYGVHMACRTTKRYQTVKRPNVPWIPVVYGTERDYCLLYEQQQAILVEGLFDRAVFARLFPQYACLARLASNIPWSLVTFLSRYVNRLLVCFDRDQAGEHGIEVLKRRLPAIPVWTLRYPAPDPNQLWQDLGDTRTQRLLQQELNII